MKPITVAIVEKSQEKRSKLERFLEQDKNSLRVLRDTVSIKNDPIMDRRLKSRKKMSFIDNNIARINRLKPRVLVVSARKLADEECIFLAVLHYECPNVLIILLTDESLDENKMLKALSMGVRGILDYGADIFSFSKAVRAVEQGEAWVPRKILGKVMNRLINFNQDHSPRVRYDFTG